MSIITTAKAVANFFLSKGFSLREDVLVSCLGSGHMLLRSGGGCIDALIQLDTISNCVNVELALVDNCDASRDINVVNYNEAQLEEFYSDFWGVVGAYAYQED